MPLFHVIESPRDQDLYDNALEAVSISQIARFLSWSVVGRVTTSRSTLQKAIQDVGIDSESLVIHLVAHGDKKGILLTDTDFIPWNELSTMIGETLSGKILVLSACESEHVSALCTDMKNHGKPPILVLGTQRNITYEEAAIGWPLFYFTMRRASMETTDIKEAFQRGVKLVNAVINRFCTYYRWDEKNKQFYHFDRAAQINWDPPQD